MTDINPYDVMRPVISLSLGHLAAANPVAFYELVAACRDCTHALWPGTAAPLLALSLIESVGTDDIPAISSITREVVLELTDGLDLDMGL